jgi:methylmalonyl-CoA/ethylmalonyl-CoA epimerase
MAILKIEHLGIAVADLKDSNELFTRLLGKSPYKSEAVESEGVETSFFEVGASKIELLQARKPDSAIARFLEKKGAGFHHIAFLVDDLETEIERLTKEGFQPIMDEPKTGADNKNIFFFHPKSTNGLLVELCEERS